MCTLVEVARAVVHFSNLAKVIISTLNSRATIPCRRCMLGQTFMYRYPVILTPDPESGFTTVTFPDIPEAITQGRDVPDALKHAVDGLETAMSIYMDKRLGIPLPRKVRGGYYVDLPPIS